MRAEEKIMINHQIKRVNNMLSEFERISYSELKRELFKVKDALIDLV